MKHYVHLKDGVVWAHHKSEGEIESSDTIIEVEGDEETYINKKYENGQFVDAPFIKYAILDKNNIVINIEKTYFLSDVKDNIIINDPDVEVMWKWNGTSFVSPNNAKEAEIIIIDNPTKEIPPIVENTPIA